MKFSPLLTDDAIAGEVGRRIAAIRLERRMTQAQVAAAAGVAKRTVERLEDGQPAQLATLIRCLRVLDRLDGLERLLPEVAVNPIDQLRGRRAARQRVRPSKAEATGMAEGGPAKPWVWGDER